MKIIRSHLPQNGKSNQDSARFIKFLRVSHGYNETLHVGCIACFTFTCSKHLHSWEDPPDAIDDGFGEGGNLVLAQRSARDKWLEPRRQPRREITGLPHLPDVFHRSFLLIDSPRGTSYLDAVTSFDVGQSLCVRLALLSTQAS